MTPGDYSCKPLGRSREPLVLTRSGWTNIETNITRLSQIRAKAAPLQALGKNTLHKYAGLIEHEHENPPGRNLSFPPEVSLSHDRRLLNYTAGRYVEREADKLGVCPSKRRRRSRGGA